MKRLVPLALVLLVAATGCGSPQATPAAGKDTPAPAGPAATPAPKVIKVGFIAPLTGDVMTFGESAKKGTELALEQAGYKAGDYKIELLVGDDRNDATEGINVATKMVSQQGAKAIIGALTSKVAIPIGEYANAQKVVQISGTSTAAKLTVDDKGVRKPFIFRACFIDPFQGKVAAKFAAETLKVKSAAVLYDKGNDYTVGLAENFKSSFQAAGGKVVAEATYSDKDADFSAILTKIAEAKPDFLYLPDYYQKVSLIGKQAKTRGLNVPMMGGDGWDSSDLDYATMAGGYFTNHYSSADPRPEVQKLVKDFQAKYSAAPDALAVLFYDSTNILLESIRQANSDDPDKIRAAMQGLKDFPTVSGKVTFDKDGNPVKSAVILQVQADKTQKYIQTIQP